MSKFLNRFRLRVFLAVFVFAMLACNLIAGPDSNPAIPQDFSAQTSNTPLPPTPPLESTTTPDPSLVPTQVDPLCVPSGSPHVLAEGDFNSYPTAVLDFLNQGGLPDQLDAALYEAGVANQPVSVAFTDLTGDQKIDVVVSIYNPASQKIVPAGKLLVYICQESHYSLGYEIVSQENWGAPQIRFIEDMNTDGLDEIVTSSTMCGAHTCFERVQILMWDGESFANRLEGSTAELPYPDTRITDEDGDGVYALEVSASGFGSVGAGPPRGETWVWTYNVEHTRWEKTNEILAASNYRIHVLYDADQTALQGNYDEALLLYGRVLSDSTLEDWLDPASESANLGAYALFKSGVIHYLHGEADLGAATFDQLRSAYPPQDEGSAYARLADVFQAAYASGGLSAGCRAVQESAKENAAQVLEPLGPETFGYGNPQFEPEDICPWD